MVIFTSITPNSRIPLKYSIVFVLLILLNLNNSAFGQDSIVHPKNWELVLNLSYNNYNTVYRRPSVNYTTRINVIPQFDIGFRRNIRVANKMALGVGLSYRFIPFTIKYGYSTETSPNLIDPEDYTYTRYTENIEIPIVVKYYLLVGEKNKLLGVYAGFTYSITGYPKSSLFRGYDLYDPYRNDSATFYLDQQYYPNVYYKNTLFSTVWFDYFVQLGSEYHISPHFKVSAHISYYPKEVIVVDYLSTLNCTCYGGSEEAKVYRPKFLFGLGFSYLFNF